MMSGSRGGGMIRHGAVELVSFAVITPVLEGRGAAILIEAGHGRARPSRIVAACSES